jgi:DNA gyrase subunit B
MADHEPSSFPVLKGLEAIRRRPSLYIGDTSDGSGLYHLLASVIDDAVDEHVCGTASYVSVHIDGDTVTVEDDGRGIPIDIVEVVFTTISHAFARDWRGRPLRPLAGSCCAPELAPVTALSARLEVQVCRDGRLHRAVFERGELVGALRDEGPTTRQGTRIRITPDFTIFARQAWDVARLRERVRELAALNPRLEVRFQEESFVAPCGIVDHARHLAGERRWLHAEPLRVRGQHADMEVDVALAWTGGKDTRVIGFVCQSAVAQGTHIEGFWQGVQRALANVAPGEIGNVPISAVREVMGPGLAAVIHVAMRYPRFANWSLARLMNPEVKAAVAEVLAESLSAQLRQQPELLHELLRRLPSTSD